MAYLKASVATALSLKRQSPDFFQNLPALPALKGLAILCLDGSIVCRSLSSGDVRAFSDAEASPAGEHMHLRLIFNLNQSTLRAHSDSRCTVAVFRTD